MKGLGLKPARRGSRGFTLVEVLVALMIMAILASLAWQGLDGILRAREGSRDSIDATVRLTTVVTQWEQDLQALYDTGLVPAISFDGQTLRVTRRTEGGVMLVAWSVRSGLWQRWTSQPVARGGELQELWLRSQQLVGNEAGHLTLAEGVSQWQVYFNRGGQWTNAQSTGDLVQQPIVAPLPASSAPNGAEATPTPTPTPGANAPQAGTVTLREALPDAVRLQLTLNGRTLIRDIALGGG